MRWVVRSLRRALISIGAAVLAGAVACNLLIGLRDDYKSAQDATAEAARYEASAPSCVGMDPTCGLDGSDCCESPTVPGGTYNRLNDASFPATVSPFRLDRFEVTVGRFRRYVDALPRVENEALRANLKTCVGATWTDAPGALASEQVPINCVLRADAIAFCAWDNGRLPTEAEWNFAAAGGNLQRYFPWSNPPASRAFDASFCVYAETTSFDATPGPSALAQVGSKPLGAGVFGHLDLSGNAYEIVLDQDGPLPVPCIDCWIDAGFPNRLLHRGGSYASPAIPGVDGGGFYLSTTYRDGDPDARGVGQGFRCARKL